MGCCSSTSAKHKLRDASEATIEDTIEVDIPAGGPHAHVTSVESAEANSKKTGDVGLKATRGGVGVSKSSPDVQNAPKTSALRHVFFDFDQTISVVHVFKQLANWEPGIPPPHAQCERGQIHRILELNAAGKWSFVPQTGAFSLLSRGSAGGDSWTTLALGGPARVDSLRALFSELRERGVKQTIITKGNVGAVRCLLAQENLLDYFERVYGAIGEEVYGTSDYDLKHKQPSEYEGQPDTELQTPKADLIREIMRDERLEESQTLLVEDDRAEIESVSGICRSVFVAARKGMTSSEISNIREMMG